MIHVFSLVCLMLATTSCGWVKLQPDTYKDSETQFLKAELPRYKHPSGQPQFCLALSGGGIRSAAYSIGVLKGLHVIRSFVTTFNHSFSATAAGVWKVVSPTGFSKGGINHLTFQIDVKGLAA